MRTYARRRLRRIEELRKWRELVRRIAEASREEMGEDTRVYVFGSAVRGSPRPPTLTSSSAPPRSQTMKPRSGSSR